MASNSRTAPTAAGNLLTVAHCGLITTPLKMLQPADFKTVH